MKRSEEERIRQKHLAKERKAQQEENFLYENSDGIFAFIAGYTGGGVPFGITWEELGLEPYASYEELMEAYDRLDRQRENGMSGEDDEFWGRKIYSDAGNLKHSFLLVKPELLWYDTGNRKGYLLSGSI